MLFEIPAMPRPAPMFASTMPKAVQAPTAMGPMISERGRF